MSNLFHFLDNDSPFGKICTFLGTLIVANLLFVITLIPVITAGAGLTALYFTMLRLIRYKEINPFSEFWEGFKDNFKQATIAWVCFLLVGVFLGLDTYWCSLMTGILRSCVYVVFAGIILVALVAMYMFPVTAAFAGSLKDNLKNSIYFIGRKPLYAVIIAVLNIAPMLLTYLNMQYLPLAAFIWCICGFSIIAFCNSQMLMRLFRKHLEPVEEELDIIDEKKLLEEMRKLEC